jgi:hypothetical protein
MIAARPVLTDPLRLRLAYGVGWLRLAEGRQAEGLALLGLVLHHPATTFDLQEPTTRLLEKWGIDAADTAVALQRHPSDYNLAVLLPTSL